MSAWMLQVLLRRLEDSVSAQSEMEERVPADSEGLEGLNGDDAAEGLDEAAIREFLSAKNLKNVRTDSSRKPSGCFGRRLDRIGSMSSLGCNTVGKYSKSQLERTQWCKVVQGQQTTCGHVYMWKHNVWCVVMLQVRSEGEVLPSKFWNSNVSTEDIFTGILFICSYLLILFLDYTYVYLKLI